MKKIMSILLMICMLTVAFYAPSQAKEAEEYSIKSVIILPTLTFNGNTGNCGLTVRCSNSSDSISAILKLWRGTTLIATWSSSGTGYLSMSKTKTVTSGYTYKLTADVKINGVSQPTVSVSKYH